MRNVSAKQGTRVSGAMFIVIVVMTLVRSTAVTADQPILDPKSWCNDAAQLIATKETEELIDVFVAGTRGRSQREIVAQSFGGLAPMLAREGRFHSSDLFAEKRYGQSYSRFWYLLLFDNGPISARCEAMKYEDSWAISSINLQTEPDKINLPTLP
jgi:hypothetical protein